MHLFIKSLVLSLLIVLAPKLQARSLVLDGIGVGPAVTVTGGGGPSTSSVELFRNGMSVGSAPTNVSGQFSFTNVTSALNDSFTVSAGQVWNFNADGNTEGWNGNGDTSIVTGGIWKQTETANGSDMGLNIYGSGLIRSKDRALEIRMRFQGAGSHPSSIILQTAGPDGLAGGGDDTAQSFIVGAVNLQSSADFKTYLFDLGTDHTGNATNWLDSFLPIYLGIFVNGTNPGDTLEVDSIRLTESMKWEFDSNGDLSEWLPAANTTLSNSGGGLIRMQAIAPGAVAMTGPFRNIGSGHFTRLETRLRQVTSQQPNLIQWNYLSNPSAYGNGGFQVSGLPANGNFQTVAIDLTAPPAFGNAWGAGGAATLNAAGGAFQSLFAGAGGDFAEIDSIRLHPESRYGPSAAVVASGTPVSPSYYISFNGGSDLNSGRSPGEPWKTFENLAGLTLGAGSTVYLKRGETWPNRKLSLTGKGAPGNPITLTAYGEGANPRLTGINLTTEPCIVWNNPSHVLIDSMDCRDAKVGLYLRFTGGNTDGTGAMFNNSDVHVANCHFKNMDEVWSDGNGDITVQGPFELSWGAGIWIGGSIPAPPGGPWPSESTPILDDFSVTHCGFDQVSTGLGMNFYFPGINRSRFTNLRFEDSWVTGCENGSMALFFVDGGHARRVDTWLGGDGFYATGTTAGFIQHMQNFTIDDCQFAFNKQNVTGNDGTGFDYEGNTANVVFTNNVIHDNDGSGMLLIDSAGGNTGFNMSDNTFWNNCRKPRNSGQNTEMRGSNGNTGTYSNNGIYLGAANAFGTPEIYNNPGRWSAFAGFATNRTDTPYSAVSARPLTWSFAANVEGWGGANDWANFGWSGGALAGSSFGADPYVESPFTWVNTRERRWVLVRMSQTAGTIGQVFFETETSPGFSEPKSVSFPIIADGLVRDYVVDLGQSAAYKGVVTKWRLDPTDSAGSSMVIDHFDSMADPYLQSASVGASNTIDLRFNQAMHPDGGVFNPATYSLSGLGQGTTASQPSSVSLISTASGPVYRLTWNSGHMNGLDAVINASAATDARGIPLWSGSQLAITTAAKPETDADNDLMPDDWEDANSLNRGLASDAGEDDDGDGISNLDEYRANTDPQDAASRFRILSFSAPTGDPGTVDLTWSSANGMAYHIETSGNLLNWSRATDTPIVSAGPQTSTTVSSSGDRFFIRVLAHRPNPLIVASP